jgi:hypothetical protein
VAEEAAREGAKVMYFITEHGRIGGLKSEVAGEVVPRDHRQDALNNKFVAGPGGAVGSATATKAFGRSAPGLATATTA